MSRPKRVRVANFHYHIFARTHNKKEYFREDWVKELYELILKEAQDHFCFELHNYVIMPNHVHLIIKPTRKKYPIDRIMQYIQSQFARRYNKQVGRRGAFWNERYGCKVAELQKKPTEYLYRVNCYLWENPYNAGLVDCAEAYEHSGIHKYLDPRKKDIAGMILPNYFLELGSSTQVRMRRILCFKDSSIPIFFRHNKNIDIY
ncbi:MAG: hypothetical protein EOM23_09800 [Candidatus Moranbacteria bacterium]|nr:hypothetical protein [Candidatus Moranbacteria bacterium]